MDTNTNHVRDMMQRLSTGSKIDSNNLKEAVEKISYGAGIKTEDYPEFDTVCRITNEISDHAVEIQHEIFENAIEAWGFKKSDVENALIELQEYRKIGTVEEVREAVEKQKPKKINHIHKEYNEHLWERYENGKINDMAFESGYHYGPICERCGYSFCVGCDPEGWDKEKCVTDDYLCPTCGTYVGMIGSYCKECGQRLEE